MRTGLSHGHSHNLPLELAISHGILASLLMNIFVEVVLLACVLAYDWVEKQRLMRGLADHRGAVGRAAWVIFAGLISIGLAGI